MTQNNEICFIIINNVPMLIFFLLALQPIVVLYFAAL